MDHRKRFITEQELIQGLWRMSYSTGRVATETLSFLPQGRIAGYSHPNEAFWRIEEGDLCFIKDDGRTITTRFTEVSYENELWILKGRYLLDPGWNLAVCLQQKENSPAEVDRGLSQRRATREPPAEVELLRFERTIVSPYTSLFDSPRLRGGPSWSNWAEQISARHCRNRQPIDQEPEECTPDHHVDVPAVWCGPICDHFGHQIADFSTRLLDSVNHAPTHKFVFSSSERRLFSHLVQTPRYFQEIVDWFGLPRDEIYLASQPALFDELYVVPQAEQLHSVGPSQRYLADLDELTVSRLGRIDKSGLVFVSRAGMPSRIAGEAYLEEIFTAAGATIIRPERLSLRDQLASYVSADTLIFSEGSAIHGAQLLGRSLGDVHVLMRRPGQNCFGDDFLRPRARTLEYVRAVAGSVHGLNPGGQPALQFGMTVLREDEFLQWLRRWGSNIGLIWNSEEFQQRRDADIQAWLHAFAKHFTLATTEAKEAVSMSLDASGVGHLRALAREILS